MAIFDQQLPTDSQRKLSTEHIVAKQGAENALSQVRKLQVAGSSEGKTGAALVVGKDGSIPLSDPYKKIGDGNNQQGFPGKANDKNGVDSAIDKTPPPPTTPGESAPAKPAISDAPATSPVPKQGDTPPPTAGTSPSPGDAPLKPTAPSCGDAPVKPTAPSSADAPPPQTGAKQPGDAAPPPTPPLVALPGAIGSKPPISTPDTTAPKHTSDKPGSDSTAHGGHGKAHHHPANHQQSTPPYLILN